MIIPSAKTKVYLALGATDMRKAINGLSMLAQGTLELDPFSGHLFVFCNRRCKIIKILYWDRNGFCLWHKRLEEHRFKWPESEQEIMAIDQGSLKWLLYGLDIADAHKTLYYQVVS